MKDSIIAKYSDHRFQEDYMQLSELECYQMNENIANFDVNMFGRVLHSDNIAVNHIAMFLQRSGNDKIYENDVFFRTVIDYIYPICSDLYYKRKENWRLNIQDVLNHRTFQEELISFKKSNLHFRTNTLSKIF